MKKNCVVIHAWNRAHLWDYNRRKVVYIAILQHFILKFISVLICTEAWSGQHHLAREEKTILPSHARRIFSQEGAEKTERFHTDLYGTRFLHIQSSFSLILPWIIEYFLNNIIIFFKKWKKKWTFVSVGVEALGKSRKIERTPGRNHNQEIFLKVFFKMSLQTTH